MRRFVVPCCAVLLALSIVMPVAAEGPAEAALGSYLLTMDNTRKMAKAFENLDAAIKADPSIKAKYEQDAEGDDSNGQTADGIIAKLQEDPTAQKAFESAGISIRDGVLTMIALTQAAAGDYLVKQGAQPPPGWPAGNLKFYQQNRDELGQIGETLTKLWSFQSMSPDSEESEDEE
jgi:hypothetical protein